MNVLGFVVDEKDADYKDEEIIEYPFGAPEEYEGDIDKDVFEFLLYKIKSKHISIGGEIDRINETLREHKNGREFELINALLDNKKEHKEIIGTIALAVGPIVHIYDDNGMYVSFIIADDCYGDINGLKNGDRVAVVIKRLIIHEADWVHGHVAISITKIKKKKAEGFSVAEYMDNGDIIKCLIDDFSKCLNQDCALALNSLEIAEFFQPGRSFEYSYALAHAESEIDYEEAANNLRATLTTGDNTTCFRWLHVRLNPEVDDYIEKLFDIADIMEKEKLIDGKCHVTAVAQPGMYAMAQIFLIVSKPVEGLE